MEPKFCKDCKYLTGPNLEPTRCSAPQIPTAPLDLVTGKPHPIWAELMREDKEYCGKDAAWFVAKQPDASSHP